MARKKMRKFAEAGEIIVEGRRPSANVGFDDFRLQDYMSSRGGGMGGDMGGMGGGAGGGASSQRIAELTAPSMARERMPIMPAVVRSATSDLAKLMGQKGGRGYGASFKTDFKKGGKVKKMAKGGSTASKRADGCATKGKTKGRFV